MIALPASRSCDRREAESILLGHAPAELSVFKELWWWDTVSRAAGIPYDLVAISHGGDDVAVMPLFRHSLPLVRRLGAPLRGTFTSCVGLRPLGARIGDQAACLQAVVRHARTGLRANWMEFGYSVAEEPVALQVHGGTMWRREVKRTIVAGVAQTEQNAWSMLEGRARNAIRKAEREGVRVIRLAGEEEDVDRFHAMLTATFAKSATVPPHSKRFYAALLRELLAGEHALFLAAERDGERLAFGIFPFNAYEMQYLSGTSSPAGNALGANSLIQWEAIRFAVGRGIRRYDLGGAGIASIDKFKTSFGGRPEIYTRYTWMAPWLRGALNAYLAARPVLQNVRARWAARDAKDRPPC
jgi:predicted N-acyltransferase